MLSQKITIYLLLAIVNFLSFALMAKGLTATSSAWDNARQFTHVAAELSVRNPYGAKNYIETEHFAYWYDDDFVGREHELYPELERLEYSWQILIEQQGYLAPVDNFKLNVYLETAGSDAVPFEGYTGHVKTDPQGYPFIMMGKPILAYELRDARLHSTHEFFHTIQYAYAAGGNIFRDSAGWFMEASAGWAAIAVWQQPLIMQNYLFSIAPTPYLALDTYLVRASSAQVSTPSNIHHYSMAILLYFLDQKTDHLLVKQVIEQLALDLSHDLDLDALAIMRSILIEQYGLSLNELAAEFHARNIFWDYEVSEQLIAKQDELGISNNSRALVNVSGMDNSWQHMLDYNTAGLPRSTGAAYLHVNQAELSEIEFSFYAQNADNSSVMVDWLITLITQDGNISYQTITANDGVVDKQVLTLNSSGEAWLSITPVSQTHNAETEFEFSFQFAQVGQSTEYQAPSPPVNLGNDIVKDTKKGGALTVISLLFLLSFLLRYAYTHRENC